MNTRLKVLILIFLSVIIMTGALAQVAISVDGSLPDSSAMLDVKSDSKGFLPPRLTAVEISAIPSPAEGLMVFNTTDEHVYIFAPAINAWKRVTYDSQVISPPLTCGSVYSVNHYAGSVAPVTKTVTYGTIVTDLTGSDKCWITQNLGADHQALSAMDASESSAGWYWQFNRMQGYKHDGITITPITTWINNIVEDSDWTDANDPCTLLLSAGWRLPTDTEWSNADVNGGWDYYVQAYASVLKLHLAGFTYGGGLASRGSQGLYWSSSQKNNAGSWFLFINLGYCGMEEWPKGDGLSVRCLRDL